MDRIENTKEEKQLNELSERLNSWREMTEGKGKSIPKEIWFEAVVLARTVGVSCVSRKLGLSFPKLRDLAFKSPGGKDKPKEITSDQISFVEVPLKGVNHSIDRGFELRLRWGIRNFKLEMS